MNECIVNRNDSHTSTRSMYAIPDMLVMTYMFSFPIQESDPAKSPNPFLYSDQFRVKFTEPLSCCIRTIQSPTQGRGLVVTTDIIATFCCTEKHKTNYICVITRGEPFNFQIRAFRSSRQLN